MRLVCTVTAELDNAGGGFEREGLEELAGELENIVAEYLILQPGIGFSIEAAANIDLSSAADAGGPS